MVSSSDREVLQALAKEYLDFCNTPEMEEKRKLWRNHNSFAKTTPPVIVKRGNWCKEVPEIMERKVEDDNLYPLEKNLRTSLFYKQVNDDTIFEPWLTIRAAFNHSGWGIDLHKNQHKTSEGGSWKHEPPMKNLEDLSVLEKPRHEIDEEKTKEYLKLVEDAFDGAITIELDRKPYYYMWQSDISTVVGYLRGIEQIMFDMIDEPEAFHKLLAFMRDGILEVHDKAEKNGDWKLTSQENQAMPYAKETKDPKPATPAKRSDLWFYCAAQEYTLISPDMHNEFLLQYQLPIIEKFGLSAYGCCEDLSNKIPMLRQIKNLRRIGISPMADLKKSAEEIEKDYILSWRPSPADMLSFDFNPDKIDDIYKDSFDVCRGSHLDITMKDLETINNDPARVGKWIALTRKAIDEYWKP